jgi:hypothetical protein
MTGGATVAALDFSGGSPACASFVLAVITSGHPFAGVVPNGLSGRMNGEIAQNTAHFEWSE